MDKDPLFIFRVLSAIALVATALGGGYLAANHKRLFGVDPAVPSENGSSRVYNATQIWVLWLHLMLLFATGAIYF